MNEQVYQSSLKMGLIEPLESDIDYWRACFADFKLHPPKDIDWPYVAKELRLLSLEEAERPTDATMSNGDLVKELRKISENLKDAHHRMNVVLMKATRTNAEIAIFEEGYPQPSSPIFSWAVWADRLADKIAEETQRPRWRQKALRRSKVMLACKLSELFEQCFHQDAAPVGGSEFRKLEDTNDWTRFFQAVVFSFFGDRQTNDRQAVLWEASKILRDHRSDTPR
jgi:hypothetical protein